LTGAAARAGHGGDPEAYLRRTLYNLAADGFRRHGTLQRKLLLLRAATLPPADPIAEVDLRMR
jgi:DNA-directed RNA polymerase specialized sigma24 family protein